METPKTAAQQIRSVRNHTPRLSERKKKLFEGKQDDDDDGGEQLAMKGIQLLGKSKNSNQKTPKSTKTIEALMGGPSTSEKKSPRVISFFETESDDGENNVAGGGGGGKEQQPSPTRRSVRLSIKRSSPSGSKSGSDISTSPHKENIPLKTPTRKQKQEQKQLQKLFTNSMQITPREKSIVIDDTSSSEDELEKRKKVSTVRKNISKRHNVIEGSTGLSPMRKVAKNCSSPLASVSISTKSFYSGTTKPSPPNTNRGTCRNLFGQTLNANTNTAVAAASSSTQPTRVRSGKRGEPTLFRRGGGVRHKARKRLTTNVMNCHHAPVDINRILKNMRNEKLKNLILSSREKQQQIEKIHSIFRQASNPIAMAKPLSTLSCSQDDTNNNNIITTKSSSTSERTSGGGGGGGPYDSYKPRSSRTTTLDSEFSDIECDSVEEDEEIEIDNDFEQALLATGEEVIPLIKYVGMEDEISTKSDDVSVVSTKKKFFKSGCQTSTRKEVTITGNIKATMSANGKLSLKPEKKKVRRRLKIRNSVASEFSDEQATVDAILRNLDDTAFGDIILAEDDAAPIEEAPENTEEFLDEIDLQLSLMKDTASPPPNLMHSEEMPQEDDEDDDVKPDCNEFIQRLPYMTADPEIIERQHLLLDFLISNNICTEENFTIFIADPDNHKEEAERIIDELVMVVTGQQHDFRHRLPYNTSDPEMVQQQLSFLDFLEENNLCTEDNFDIFIGNYEQRKSEADEILAQYMIMEPMKVEQSGSNTTTTTTKAVIYAAEEEIIVNQNASVIANKHATNYTALANEPSNSSAADPKLFPVFYPGGCQPLSKPTTKRKPQRCWNAGYGSDQYQIDAGQKAFGATQCKQCGLVYTAHEPEEEKVHRDFHASLHVLRFKGWIDEDIMAIFPEWGQDGRIIRLSESSALKRKERLMDILKIVDKELGFSTYIVPRTFVAYFAVRKMQIVGLCLVQPLEKASKYMNVNGVDCCTEEQFEVKCGISRIWVSPLHRRFHIATKLIQAVQLNTIYGEEIPLDKIAFSAPTEMGKAFAQKLTNSENFLVYQ